ncbi:MAG: hypothetical protein STHCBS139747_007472 [Sporothrix thermara]
MTDYFDNYFFTSSISGYTCPGFGGNVCRPPNACARDPNNGRRYCCDVTGVCWTLTETCAKDGSTTDCGTGSQTWCCVDGREECTATKNQINICWATHHDILNNITNKVLNNTYSSLSKAHPSATTWAFDPLSLIALTAPPTSSATPSSAVSSAASSASAASSSSASFSNAASAASTSALSTSPADSTGGSKSISGGAIAGIVIGSVAGVALIAGVLFYLWRRARNKKMASGSYQAPGSGPVPGGIPAGAVGGASGLDDKQRYAGASDFGTGDYGSNAYYGNAASPMPPASAPVSELHGNNLPPPQELPASTAFGAAAPSELSAMSPSVPTAYTGISNYGSPASGSAMLASTNASPELAYQQAHQPALSVHQ